MRCKKKPHSEYVCGMFVVVSLSLQNDVENVVTVNGM